jgi:hypothetical protein
MIRNALASSLVFVTYLQILSRPIVPPTEEVPLFSRARQRVHLSATLGEGGELERSFGRAPAGSVWAVLGAPVGARGTGTAWIAHSCATRGAGCSSGRGSWGGCSCAGQRSSAEPPPFRSSDER